MWFLSLRSMAHPCTHILTPLLTLGQGQGHFYNFVLQLHYLFLQSMYLYNAPFTTSSPIGLHPNIDSNALCSHLETTSVVNPFATSSSDIGQRTLCVLISAMPDVVSHPIPTAQWGVLPQNGYAVQPRLYVGFPESVDVCRMYNAPNKY
jgi:hypothetical protein